MRYLLIFSLLSGCNVCYDTRNLEQDHTKYNYVPNYKTNLGINVYDPNRSLSERSLDETSLNVLNCVKRVWPDLSELDKQKMWCYGYTTFEIKECLTVYVPDDWYISSCTGEQIFPCVVSQSSCIVKGQDPNPNCPCSCRAMKQGDHTIVTTPNLLLYPQELTRIMTGCYYPYGTKLEECVSTYQIYKE